MNKDKQIKEIVKVILKEPHLGGIQGFEERIAKNLYDADYRKQEWISVEERFPEEYETVLVFCDTGARKFQCVSEMIEPNGKRWSAVCGFRVTHWMPLPEAPKKGDKTDA